MSDQPCPHCGAERRYGVPENDPEATPEPATCACGAEGPPNYPYEQVADKLHEISCDGFHVDNELTCPCGQPVAVGRSEENIDVVVAHRIPHCTAFLEFDCAEYLDWLNNPANRTLH